MALSLEYVDPRTLCFSRFPLEREWTFAVVSDALELAGGVDSLWRTRSSEGAAEFMLIQVMEWEWARKKGEGVEGEEIKIGDSQNYFQTRIMKSKIEKYGSHGDRREWQVERRFVRNVTQGQTRRHRWGKYTCVEGKHSAFKQPRLEIHRLCC